jgi:O-antigen ligase
VAWTPRLARVCLGVLVVLALALVGVGFVEYATRHLFLNPKVIASNQLEDYFRVNSLFFDPNIYGRFLALVMLLLAAWLLWARRQREVLAAGLLLAVLWGGLVLTFSQSSFTALLVGLAILGAMRWSVRWALILSGGALVVAVAFVALAPGAVHLDLGNSKSADKATSGRYDLIKGGLKLFKRAPLVGQGSGSFAREYRRAEHVSPERAASASHTIPVTVAAEQGAIGLLAYLALLAAALARLFRGARTVPERAAVAAAFVALVAHSMMYAAFLEDPLTWTLLGAGTAMALWAAVREPAPA